MVYTVKEIFYTLQGEGAQAGMAAVFCRFAGCNLWTGRESERTSAICSSAVRSIGMTVLASDPNPVVTP